MVDLVAVFQSSQDGDRVFHRGLIHLNRLKAPLQRGILLDVLAVFIECRCAYAVQLAARQHGLEQVARVHRALGLARAHNSVQFVNEENDVALRLLNLFEHRLEAFFKLAAILGARDERAHVERDDPFVLQALGHIATHYSLGKPFDYRSLADPRLAYEHRVVFRAARKDLNNAADLVVAANHGIELALRGELGKVASISFESFIGSFRILRCNALVAAYLLQSPSQSFARDAKLLEDTSRSAPISRHGKQQVLY